MKVTVNGDEQEIAEGLTLRELLENLNLPLPRLAVERNLEVVPKGEYGETRLTPGDRIEIVHFVGGG